MGDPERGRRRAPTQAKKDRRTEGGDGSGRGGSGALPRVQPPGGGLPCPPGLTGAGAGALGAGGGGSGRLRLGLRAGTRQRAGPDDSSLGPALSPGGGVDVGALPRSAHLPHLSKPLFPLFLCASVSLCLLACLPLCLHPSSLLMISLPPPCAPFLELWVCHSFCFSLPFSASFLPWLPSFLHLPSLFPSLIRFSMFLQLLLPLSLSLSLTPSPSAWSPTLSYPLLPFLQLEPSWAPTASPGHLPSLFQREGETGAPRWGG